MHGSELYQLEVNQLKWFLIITIAVIIAFTIFYLTLTIVKKQIKINKKKKTEIYQKHIDKILFSILFSEADSASFSFDPILFKEKLFKKLAIKSIISLHRNYAGVYKQKLELFYVESGLVLYSLHKINSSSWSAVVEGVRDVCNLHYLAGINVVKPLLNHSNEMVRKEVVIGLIRLKNLDQLNEQNYTNIYFNDWLQSEILYTVKTDQLPEPSSIKSLLKSENVTIQILAVRLITYFQNSSYLNDLNELLHTTSQPKLVTEIKQATQILKTQQTL